MTHDYKAALDGMVDGRAGVGDWFITHKDAIRQALTLAAEHERGDFRAAAAELAHLHDLSLLGIGLVHLLPLPPVGKSGSASGNRLHRTAIDP